MYQHEHRKGGSYPAAAVVKAIVERYNGKSAMGEGEEGLCIVRYYLDLPLDKHPWNAVLVSTHAARHLPRTQTKREYMFPPGLQSEMKALRSTNLKAAF